MFWSIAVKKKAREYRHVSVLCVIFFTLRKMEKKRKKESRDSTLDCLPEKAIICGRLRAFPITEDRRAEERVGYKKRRQKRRGEKGRLRERKYKRRKRE